jgi:hypothetical protein
MAILAIVTGRGVTAAMYDALRKQVNWEADHPAGGVFHAAGLDANGDLHVADVWDSQAAFEAFVSGRLGPAFGKLGIPPPTHETFELHNATAYAAVDRYKK